jgi:hypothetical protein
MFTRHRHSESVFLTLCSCLNVSTASMAEGNYISSRSVATSGSRSSGALIAVIYSFKFLSGYAAAIAS